MHASSFWPSVSRIGAVFARTPHAVAACSFVPVQVATHRVSAALGACNACDLQHRCADSYSWVQLHVEQTQHEGTACNSSCISCLRSCSQSTFVFTFVVLAAAGMALPLCLDRLVNVAVALVLSTTAIVLFGECVVSCGDSMGLSREQQLSRGDSSDVWNPLRQKHPWQPPVDTFPCVWCACVCVCMSHVVVTSSTHPQVRSCPRLCAPATA